MNTKPRLVRVDPAPVELETATPARLHAMLPKHVHRPRDFGVGYGNSSGYGDGRHFVDGHVDPMFRFV